MTEAQHRHERDTQLRGMGETANMQETDRAQTGERADRHERLTMNCPPMLLGPWAFMML